MLQEQLELLPGLLAAHIRLSLLALILGVVISVPLGIAATRLQWLEQPVLAVASVVQTIPSLALLAIMVPLLAALQFQSIGFLPAFVGLTLYGILPILRNTVTGIRGVDPALAEAARGVGMTSGQRLLRVELPLAMPVIVAGIRTSTVWIVGIATLSTPVGARSLGNYIFTGLQTRNYTAVMVGCVAAAILALVLDGMVRAWEWGLERRKRWVSGVVIGGLALILASSLGWHVAKGMKGAAITVGSKTFTEQYILSEILAKKMRNATDMPVEVMQSLGSTVVFDALGEGQIDVYVDYTGTIWANVMGRNSISADREDVLESTRVWLRTEYGIELLAVLGFENAYALAMPASRAKQLGIETIGDLQNHDDQWTLGGDYEFFGRPEWKAIKETYKLSFADRRSMDASLMYQAVSQGDVNVISAFSTDGRIEALDLKILEDDRDAVPPYDAIVLARAGFAKDHPEAAAALKTLEGAIDAKTMRQLNMAVDKGKRSAADVAQEFLDRGSSDRE